MVYKYKYNLGFWKVIRKTKLWIYRSYGRAGYTWAIYSMLVKRRVSFEHTLFLEGSPSCREWPPLLHQDRCCAAGRPLPPGPAEAPPPPSAASTALHTEPDLSRENRPEFIHRTLCMSQPTAFFILWPVDFLSSNNSINKNTEKIE